MPTNDELLEQGYPICPEIKAENRLKAGKDISEFITMKVLWGLSQEGLNDFYQLIRKSLTDDEDERKENMDDDGNLLVRYALYPNGLLALGKEGPSERKHDNLHPTAKLLAHSKLSTKIKVSLSGLLLPISSNVVAAGIFYLKAITIDDETHVKITEVDNNSGHYRFGDNANQLASAYLHEIYPSLLTPDFKLSNNQLTASSDQRFNRLLNLCEAENFTSWLEEAKRNLRALSDTSPVHILSSALKAAKKKVKNNSAQMGGGAAAPRQPASGQGFFASPSPTKRKSHESPKETPPLGESQAANTGQAANTISGIRNLTSAFETAKNENDDDNDPDQTTPGKRPR